MRSKPNHQIQVESIEKAIVCLVGEQDRIRSEAQTAIDALRKVCAAAQPIAEDDAAGNAALDEMGRIEQIADNEVMIIGQVLNEFHKMRNKAGRREL